MMNAINPAAMGMYAAKQENMMNAVQFEQTRYGYRSYVGGACWQIRRVKYCGAESEPALYAVFTEDEIEAYAMMPTFYGDLSEARQFLNSIAVGYADSVGQ
jgi:hypothetical protein